MTSIHEEATPPVETTMTAPAVKKMEGDVTISITHYDGTITSRSV